MTIRLGLFDIMQVDPAEATSDDPDRATPSAYRRRLDHLALADELGFGLAFVAERHFMPSYRAGSPAAWLGAASQRTRRIRLGVLAYTLPLHHPALLAEEVATLDHLCAGRLEVGLGLGHRPEELVAIGVDPRQRVIIFQERLAILRALWSGGQVGFASPTTTIRDVAIHPLPLQSPHPPLWYAGTDAAAATWAGGQGMGMAVGFRPTAALAPTATAFLAGRAAAARGDDAFAPGSLALMRHVYVAETDERARAEVVDDLLRLRALASAGDRGSRSDRRALAEADADALTRDEAMLYGGTESVAAAIAAAATTLGTDTLLANVHAAGVDDERVARTLRLLASEVAPRLAEVGAGAAP